MLVSERQQLADAPPSTLPPAVQLRLHGGTRSDELVPIGYGKHSVGSGPRCSVRLAEPGVGPLHCLIVHDAEGLRARRWSSDTLLNGQTFDDAKLVAGDLLTVGSVELEIVLPLVDEAEDAAKAMAPVPTPGDDADGTSVDELAPVPSADWTNVGEPAEDDAWQYSDEMAATAGGGDCENAPAECAHDAATGETSGALLAALERNRAEYDELVERVGELEQKIEMALVDRGPAAIAAWVDQPRKVVAHAPADAFEEAEIGDFLPVEEAMPGGGSRASDAELRKMRSQLTESQRRLNEAQATINHLQQHLADQQQEWQNAVAERESWQRQLADWESRLAEYVARIGELEGQLGQVEQGSAVPRPPAPAATAAEDAPHSPQSLANSDDAVSAASQDDVELPFEQPPLPWDAAPSGELPHRKPVHHKEYDWSVHQPSGGGSVSDLTDTPLAAELGAPSWASEPSAGAAWGAEESADSEWPITGTMDDHSAELDSAPEHRHGTAVAEEPDPVDDVEQALAHLRDLSLWRQPEAASEAADLAATDPSPRAENAGAIEAVQPPDGQISSDRISDASVEPVATAAERPAETGDAPTGSYIERYAHLFDDDTTEAPGSSLDESSIGNGSSSLADGALEAAPHSAAESTLDDDEESIEQYMAQMMARLRGKSSGVAATAASDDAAGAEALEPATQPPSLEPTEPASSIELGADSPDLGEVPSDQPAPAVEEFRRKAPAPEFATDLGALRALANQTARHAIGIHTLRTLRRNATTRFIIAMLAATTSLYFMLQAPGWQSLEFATACAALLAALNWSRLTFETLVKAIRVGAFDDVASDFTGVDAASTALPIDVDRR